MDKSTKIFWSIIAVAVLFIILIAVIGGREKKIDYDVSMMNEVTVSDILNMFESKKTYVLYVGRKDCEVCVNMIPTLAEAQKQNNYITQYLDIEKVDRSSDEWLELVEKLTMKSTQTTTEDGTGEEITETYGYFLHNYGFTPTIVVIKEGKQTAGSIGGSDKDTFIKWISNKVN
ncbi:MAG: hypothetical protein IJO63_04100 [Bacilli bacterium]|nr:hypothetical protein [Bacilli bacterium]